MIDLIIFLIINAGLFGAFIVAYEYYWFVGPIAGLFGAVLTLSLLRPETELVLRTFINADGDLVYQTMPLDYFFYIPIILSVLCFAAALKKVK